MHILDFSTVSYQKCQFYIIPIQIIYEDAILNFILNQNAHAWQPCWTPYLAMINYQTCRLSFQDDSEVDMPKTSCCLQKVFKKAFNHLISLKIRQSDQLIVQEIVLTRKVK